VHSGSAFSGYRFPPEVILTALRWYFSYALSAQQVMELLAERGLDVSRRTILRWAQALGPLLGQAVRRRRLPFGQQWFVDEVFVRIGGLQQYLYRMIDETGHVVDILLREHRDTASAEARSSARRGSAPLACPRKLSVTTTGRTSRRSSTPGRMYGIGGAAYTGREGSRPSPSNAATSRRAIACAIRAA
jgi:hypothetical protein